MDRRFLIRVFLLPFTIYWLFPQIVWAGSGNDINSANDDSNPVYNSETTPGSGTVNNSDSTSTPSTYVPQQTGIVQFNNSSSSSTLTYPNCGGVCAFGIMRLTPNNNGSLNPEAVMGVVVQFDSPEKTYAQAQRDLSKAQSDRITQESQLSILSKIADAVENCQDSRANLLAIPVAKTLGMTPEELLSYAYKQPRKCNLGL